MPTSSQAAESMESSKKLDEGETKEDEVSTDASENGNTAKDKVEKDVSEEQKGSHEENIANLQASTLLAQGKRHLFVKDYPSAVAALGDACSKYGEMYGELANECADAYFNYGCALLELAREESAILDVDNKDKESEENEEGEDDAEAAEEKKKAEENETEQNEGYKQKDANSNKTDDEGKDEKSTEEKVEGEDNGGEEEEEEDVNNLQLAWEMFELAKVIFTRQSDEKKLAETFLRLGEVALESENYGSAITDIQSCLDLQKKILPPISREIAETYFQLGVACSLCNQFDDAIKHFTAAGVLLEKRIRNLNKMTEPESEKMKNPFYSIKNEIDEIKALLPEIKDKIADMEEFKNETMRAVVQATINNTIKETSDGAGPSTNGTTAAAASSSSAASTKAPVNDISHLVRKKRKTPEDANSIEPKKPCNEPTTS